MAWDNAPINFGFKVLKDADDLTKKITGEMLQGVVMRSPVDTNAYRSNHRVGIGSVNTKADKQEVGGGALTQGLTTIASSGGIGKLVFVSNSLPYALRLENGWSKQHPKGIYALTFRAVVDKYR